MYVYYNNKFLFHKYSYISERCIRVYRSLTQMKVEII